MGRNICFIFLAIVLAMGSSWLFASCDYGQCHRLLRTVAIDPFITGPVRDFVYCTDLKMLLFNICLSCLLHI